MPGAQPLERGDDFFLTLLYRVGDHTRGLFEAEASIAMSAAHPFEYIEIVFLARHVSLSQLEIPEKPTCWVVTSSTAVSGTPSSVTVTRMRMKMRQGLPRHWQ